ncbi:MAG: SGNH/GDSL hydrolase family protein [Ruminococcus sp.]
MKRILCYGDSNTWGFIPGKGLRYPWNIRWTGILSENINRIQETAVIEEGLCGRTTAYDLPLEPMRNGYQMFPVIYESAAPVDLVIIMLGTNDRRLGVSPEESGAALELYIKYLHSMEILSLYPVPDILLIAPPFVGSEIINKPEGFYYREKSAEESRRLPEIYRKTAEKYGCRFLDASSVCQASEEDNIHLTAWGHARLGEAVCDKITEIWEKTK